MYTNLTLKNFRVFDNEGIDIPLRSLTILTGCNNSGKSSITKALCLLKDFCEQIESDYRDGKKLDLERYKMDFNKRPNDVMGSFDLIVHKQTDSEDSDSKEKSEPTQNHIYFELVVESLWLLQDVLLYLEFAPLENDDLNNGYLYSYTIKTLNGDTIFKASRDGSGCSNFGIVKQSLLYFLYSQHELAHWQNELNYRNAAGMYPSGEDEDAERLNKVIRNLVNKLDGNALITLLEWQGSHCKQSWRDGFEGSASSILGKVEDSFLINSPNMNVYCYFPCFELLQNIKKEEIRTFIHDKIDSQKSEYSSYFQQIIDLFLDKFEKSEANTLHEMISNEENIFFNEEKIFNLRGKNKFSFPYPSFMHHSFNSSTLEYETELSEEADTSICLMAMDLINKLVTESDKTYMHYDYINGMELYDGENSIDTYLRNVIEEIFSKIMPGKLSYSPITVIRPQRLYSLEEDNDFNNTLKDYFEIKRHWIAEVESDSLWEYKNKDMEKHQPCSFINKWVSQLNIAHHVEIKTHANGYGCSIHLYDSENDDTGMLIADKGFGVLQLFAFLLKIENAIMTSQINIVRYRYDLSGINDELAKLVSTYNQDNPITIALEEPECHLHPSLQSKFAEIISDAYNEYGIHFLIESHSEYLVRKLQLLVSQKIVENTSVSLLYVNPKDRPSYIPAITDIGLEEDGTLKNEFGTGFFDESLRLSKELFKVKEDEDEEQA